MEEDDKKKCTDDKKQDSTEGDSKKTGDSPRLADKPSNEATNAKTTVKTPQESKDKSNEPGTNKADQGTNKTELTDKVDASKANATDPKHSQAANVKLKDKETVEEKDSKKTDSTTGKSQETGKTTTQPTDNKESKETDKAASKPTDKTESTDKPKDKSESSGKTTDATGSSGKPTDKGGTTDKPTDKTGNVKSTESADKPKDKADNTAKSADKSDNTVKATDKADKYKDKVDNNVKPTDKADDSVKSTDKVDNNVKSSDKATDTVKSTDKAGDSVKSTDKVDDNVKSTDKSGNSAKSTDKADDSVQSKDKAGDNVKSTDKAGDNVKSTDKADDSVQSKDKAGDNVKSSDKANDNVKSKDKAEDSVKSKDKADDSVKSKDKADDSVQSKDKADDSVKSKDKADDSVQSKDKADNTETNGTPNTEVPGVKDTDAEDTQENGLLDDAKQRLIDKEDEKETPGAKDKKTEEAIPLKNIEEESQPGEKKDVVPSRWVFAVLGCIGFMIVYGLKVNLSVAIIAMVNHTAVAEMALAEGHHDDHHGGVVLDDASSGNGTEDVVAVDDCGKVAKKESLEDGPFAWDENIQGIILASYFYGYLFTQVPGGWVAEKFSAKHVFGVGALVNAICAILSPLAANASYAWLIVIRIIMGIAGGVTLPGMHVLVAKWAPPQERSKIASTVYAGMTLGTLVCMPFSGLLAATLDWSAVFYVQGGLSLLWYVLWLIFVYDSPSQHPRIARAERKFIEESLGTVVKSEKPPVPWKSIWTSLPVWAIIIAHTCSNWGWYMLLVKLPTYMRYILKFDIKANAGLSAVPFLCMWIFTMILANVLDALRTRKVITTTFARKLSTLICTVLPAICLIGVTYVGCNTDLAVALLTLGTMFVGGMYSGFLSNHIDIAPPLAGTLMGISNTFATFPGIIVPSFVGFMTHGNQTVEAWRTIFFITLGVYAVGATFFTIFGSGELQEWAKPKSKTQEEGEQQKLNDVA